jgi:Sep15/SelM redox domain
VLATAALQVQDVVGDAQLTADCLACCSPDDDRASSLSEQQQRFAVAHLLVDKAYLSSFEQTEKFISQHSDSFANLEVVGRRGLRPVLLMYSSADTSGAPDEVLHIDKWDAAAVMEYLNQYLQLD